jgi:hypothetical protein
VRNQRMERVVSRFDALVWADLLEACQLLDLTPAELVAAIKEVVEAFKAGGHPLEVFIEQETQRLIQETVAQTLARQEAQPRSAAGVRIYLPEKDTPPPEPTEDDEPTEDELSALEGMLADVEARLRRREP